MSIYVHIPFCKSRCFYCDFFSTTQLARREEYVQALIHEAQQRISTIHYPLSTIYFGGGTPTMLSVDQLSRIVRAISNDKRLTTNDLEITLEANPGDLTLEKLTALRQAGFNRLSIGVQSFRDDELSLLGRRHNVSQAREAVRLAQQAGFDNISIDLMYALPGQTMSDWQYNIAEALKLHVQHISCYCLTYEPHTRLSQFVEAGTLTPADEDTENAMYDMLCQMLREEGYEHYEVSNFALPNFRSRHNSGYWNDTPYIGLGAGAHSYDGNTRRWNTADLDAYLRGEYEEEVLSPEQKAMEHIMLGLRTCEGIELTPQLHVKAQSFLEAGQVRIDNNRLIATQSGLHILNRIIESLV